VAFGPCSDLQEEAVLDGGPMDGTRLAIDARADRLCVVMSDNQQHLYLRVDEFQGLEGGHSAIIFRWNGRYFGPK
jgi:hypothetical protein